MLLTPGTQSLFDRLMPPSPKPTVTEASSKTPVTARLEATTEGVCPYCQGNMRKSRASDFEVWVCDSDRHVAPVKTS